MHHPLRAMLATLLLAGCAKPVAVIPLTIDPPSSPQPKWREALSEDDRERLDRLPQIWRSALDAVPKREQRLLARQGDLVDPDAAKDHPLTPPGSYHCRLVRIGEARGRRPAVQVFPEFFCFVRGEGKGQLSFTKQTGSELPGGWLHPASDKGLVLLGARQRAAGDNSIAYGDDEERDLVGLLERIGYFRWRLVLPSRDGVPGVDIYELWPVPPDQQPPAPDE